MHDAGNESAAERILVVKLGALGDLLLADGALQDLRAHHSNARISVLTRAPFMRLLRRCPWVDEVLVDPNRPRWRLDAMAALRQQLRDAGFTRGYDLQNSRRSAFYRRWLAGAGIAWSSAARADQLDAELPTPLRAVPERHAAQLERAGVTVRHCRRPSPTWLADDVTALLQAADIAGPFVVLLPGSSARHRHKRWPHYAALSHALHARGLQVVTLPGIDEPELGQDHAGHVLRPGGQSLDLPTLAGVLRAAACVIGNDSGPTHLAACLDAVCVALFDAGSPSLLTTGIDRRHATCLSAEPLATLSVATVETAVLARLAGR